MNDIVTQQKQQLETLLNSAGSVGIVLPTHQSLDIVAAGLSLALILQDSGKSSQIISTKEPIVEYSSLVGVDQIKPNFSGNTKTLTVSFPYKDGEIEKVSYNIEGDHLNVNLFAESQGIKFEEKDVRFIYQGSAPQVIVTIGVADLLELQGLVDPSTAKIINIDNNVSNSLFGDAVIVDSAYSSISEIIARIAVILNFQVEFDVAQNLLDGIMQATNNFSSPKTTPLAFEMTGVLMQKGAVRRGGKQPVTDTSLQMLGQKPFGSTQGNPLNQPQEKPQVKQFGQLGKQPLNQSQDKSFDSQGKSFGQPQGKQTGQKPFNQSQNKQFGSQKFQPKQQKPQFNQPQMNQDQANRLEEIKKQLRSMPQSQTNNPQIPDMLEPEQATADIPTEDEAPSDWFTPKVFKSNKN